MTAFKFTIRKSVSLYFFAFYILSVSLLVHGDHWYDYYDDNEKACSIKLSTPEECARSCQDGEKPKYCYYRFVVEFYTTVGPACDIKGQQVQCVVADGVEKTLTTINRQLPGPSIEVCKDDYIIVDVENSCIGFGITLHWHGMFQNGYQYYDGVPFVTQCPIPSGTSFRYQFRAQNSGTHFYHSHVATHMMDGQYGSLIIRDTPSADPHYDMYDEDIHTILMSDWMHELSLERFPGWYRHDLGQNAQNFLINGKGNWTDPNTNQTTNAPLAVFSVTKGKRYRFRIINSFSTVCLAELSFEGHSCTIIAQDGANVKPRVVNTLVSASGERADCIINANQTARSYWIRVRGLGECSLTNMQQFAILRYDGAPSTPSTPAPAYDDITLGVVYNPMNGTKCNSNKNEHVCVNQLESVRDETYLVQATPAAQHVIPFDFFNYTEFNESMLFRANAYPEFFSVSDRSQLASMLNNIVFQSPSSPMISERSSYETMCTPNHASRCTEPCTCSQVYHVPRGDIVEIMVYDKRKLPHLYHPFHLHGYEFKVLAIGEFPPNVTTVSDNDVKLVLEQHRQRLQRGEYSNPPGKDTAKVPLGGYVIIRFQANNPGWWLFHCHFTWHHITGMELVYHVGKPQDLPRIPDGFPKCNNWKPPLQTLNDFYSFSYV